MAWYDTGTVSVTNGSTAVVGSGTDFISAKVQVGEAFYGPDGKIYEIAAIVSSTSLTLADNYLGTTQSGQTYKIVPTQSLVADLATNVSTLITDFANVRDLAGEGKFDDGTVAAPGITFNLDQDNGLYRIGANNWAMAVGGSKIVDLTSTGIDVNGIVRAYSSSFGNADLIAESTAASGTGYSRMILKTPDREWRFINDASTSGSPFLIYDATAAATRLTITSTGNVGIGVVPSTWAAAWTALDIGDGTLFSQNNRTTGLGSNIYFTGSDWLPKETGESALYQISQGTHNWYGDSSVTSGVSFTPTPKMTLDSSGNLLVGDTSTVPFDGTTGVLIGGARTSLAFATTGHTHKMLYSVNTGTAGLHFYDSTNNRSDMIWDNSGNLLVGTTSTGVAALTSGGGSVISSAGATAIAYQSVNATDPVFLLNNTGVDGSIAEFRKDGLTVGSIGVNSGYLYVGGTEGNDAFLSFGADGVRPSTSAGAARDAAIDLGGLSNRFKDLYLSGFISGGSTVGLTTRAITSGGAAGVQLQQARGTISSPTTSVAGGDGNFITSSVYDGVGFNKIAQIGMVTGTSLDDGSIVFATAKAGSTTTKMTLDEDGNLLVGDTSTLTAARIESFGAANGVAGIGMRHTGATAGQWWRIYMQNDSKAIFTNAAGTGVSLTYGGTSWSAVSDEKLKENISDIGTVLDKVTNYRCVNYSLKATQSASADKIGFIAQDWEADFPNVVDRDENDELSMKYTETIPVLLKAIQEQQDLIESLTARIAALEGAN